MEKPTLDKKYRQFRKGTDEVSRGNSIWGDALDTRQAAISSSLDKLAAETTYAERQSYFCSVIHLCMNRIFPEQTRRYELVLSYLIGKVLKSVRAANRSRKSKNRDHDVVSMERPTSSSSPAQDM